MDLGLVPWTHTYMHMHTHTNIHPHEHTHTHTRRDNIDLTVSNITLKSVRYAIFKAFYGLPISFLRPKIILNDDKLLKISA